MIKTKIKEMIIAILEEVDSDIAQMFDPELSEDPECAEETMNTLISIVNLYLNEDSRKKKK